MSNHLFQPLLNLSLGLNLRERLSADITYYVATTGNDSNNGLSSDSPLATIQKAVDLIGTLDLAIYQATVSIAAGTYTLNQNVTLNQNIGSKSVIIQGSGIANTTITLNNSNQSLFVLTGSNCKYIFKNMRLTATAMGSSPEKGLIDVSNLAVAEVDNIDFGTLPSNNSHNHVIVNTQAVFRALAGYTISGSCRWHIHSWAGGMIDLGGSYTCNLVGNPTWNTAWVQLDEASIFLGIGPTWSGSSSGQTMRIRGNSVCNPTITSHPGNGVYETLTGGQRLTS